MNVESDIIRKRYLIRADGKVLFGLTENNANIYVLIRVYVHMHLLSLFSVEIIIHSSLFSCPLLIVKGEVYLCLFMRWLSKHI